MTISRAAAKNKGAKGEAEILIKMQQIVAIAYNQKAIPIPSLIRGRHGTDIKGLNWISPEVKRHEPTAGYQAVTQQQIAGWWDQCKSQAGPGAEPVLLYRANYQPWRVRMFGYIAVGPQGGRIRTVVEIGIDAFWIWFEQMVKTSIAHIPTIVSQSGQSR